MKVMTPTLLSLCIVIAAGCDMPPMERLNAPPQGYSSVPRLALQEPYKAMAANAMLSEMSISDVHFVPHTARLNSLGARRLEEYADLLEHYGGTLRYDSELEDSALVDDRMQQVRDFLVAAGVPLDGITVAQDIPGGRGMKAHEAVIIVEQARTMEGWIESGEGIDDPSRPRFQPRAGGRTPAAAP